MLVRRVIECFTQTMSNSKDNPAEPFKKALAEAVSRIDGAVSKGIYHRKTGSRYIARLTHQVNSLQG